jgi:hypothetical protein
MRPGEWERLRTGIALKTFTALMKRYQHMSAAEEAKKLREARRFAKVGHCYDRPGCRLACKCLAAGSVVLLHMCGVRCAQPAAPCFTLSRLLPHDLWVAASIQLVLRACHAVKQQQPPSLFSPHLTLALLVLQGLFYNVRGDASR